MGDPVKIKPISKKLVMSLPGCESILVKFDT